MSSSVARDVAGAQAPRVDGRLEVLPPVAARPCDHRSAEEEPGRDAAPAENRSRVGDVAAEIVVERDRERQAAAAPPAGDRRAIFDGGTTR